MKILHILDHSLPVHSGYTFRTAAILREQQRLGWETVQLTSPKHGPCGAPLELIDGLRFYRTPPSGSKLPGVGEWRLMRALTRRLAQVVAAERPDVLHAHSPALNAVPALRVGQRFGLPVVYEVRAFWEDAAVDHGTSRAGGLRYRLTRALETYVLKRVHHVTTICEGLRREIVDRGIAAERVTVIPNGVDPQRFRPAAVPDPALRSALGLNAGVVLGFIGSFYAYEGLDLLLEAMPRILRARADVQLLLVGGGSQEAALQAHARSLGLGARVVFAGRVPQDQITRYYDLVDVLVYPRRAMRLTELVTPLKPLEAMAQGRLLVASDVGGHRELIRDGETGVLFRADDPTALAEAVIQLLRQPQRWSGLRAAGRRFVEAERTWVGSVGRYRPIYARLLPERSGLVEQP